MPFSAMGRMPFANTNTTASGPISTFGDPLNFNAAANTQASDYDTIMANYNNIIKANQNNPITSTNVTPQTSAAPANVTAQTVTPQTINAQNVTAQKSGYQQSGDVTQSLADLSNLARTGGYTAQGIADIRARDISPTRSIYANAQQNVDRARALGGGYSPNANATQAQMARDESSQISDIGVNANAGIAQNVAANELAASGAYGSAAGAANAQQAQAGEFDANAVNQAGEFNAANALTASTGNAANALTASADNAANALAASTGNANRDTQNNQFNANNANTANTANADRSLLAQFNNRNSTIGAIQGQANLYGTTPALTNTFGNQVMQAQSSGQNQQNIDNAQRRALFGY